MADISPIRIIYSQSVDPWFNLALEEYLLRQCAKNQIMLYLWQNEQTVVIGRNQNAWKECRCQELEKDGGKLARRLSGGGAVFHDLGNLNFTFIMDKNLYDLKKQLDVILKAVRALGIDAAFSGRNDLTVQGQKFSGNAFYHGNQVSYHHGTVLVDSDFSKLSGYLQVSKEKLSSKGVESVRSRVINLKSLVPTLTIASVKNALQEGFLDIYGDGTIQDKEIITFTSLDTAVHTADTAQLSELYAKYASWEWRYGKSPQFDLNFQHRFQWGSLDVGLILRNGVISSSQIYSDAMDSLLIQQLAHALSDTPLTPDSINKKLSSLEVSPDSRPFLLEAVQWLVAKVAMI